MKSVSEVVNDEDQKKIHDTDVEQKSEMSDEIPCNKKKIYTENELNGKKKEKIKVIYFSSIFFAKPGEKINFNNSEEDNNDESQDMTQNNTIIKSKNTHTEDKLPQSTAVVENDEERRKIKYNNMAKQRMPNPYVTPCSNKSKDDEERV